MALGSGERAHYGTVCSIQFVRNVAGLGKLWVLFRQRKGSTCERFSPAGRWLFLAVGIPETQRDHYRLCADVLLCAAFKAEIWRQLR